MENIVIGIEGTVGAGKTSICRKLLDKIENSIILHGGNIYRAIVYGMSKSRKINKKENLDAFEIMKDLGIEIKLEDRETVIYMNGKKVDEKDLQSQKASMAVSQVSNMANNEKLYKFGKDLIDGFRKDYNIILSSRDIVKMYPDVTYHFFVDASIEERTHRKYKQYNKEIPKEQIKEMIQKRDELQEKSGFYKLSPNTIVLDVTNCKSPRESAEFLMEHVKIPINV